jgi:hypothetical protein
LTLRLLALRWLLALWLRLLALRRLGDLTLEVL